MLPLIQTVIDTLTNAALMCVIPLVVAIILFGLVYLMSGFDYD